MRAVTLVGEELRVVERDDPVPGPRDVVVAVRGAGLNAADLLQRRGFYPAPPGWPADIPGMEVAGCVAALGHEVSSVNIGDRVCAIVGGGAQATHCVVPAEHLIPVPKSVTLEEAGGFPEAFTTAADALNFGRDFAPGCRVLISGAAGGVGTAAVQLARAWGAHAIAVTRDDRHHARLRALGAAEVVSMSDVATLEPVGYVVELVGAAHLEHVWKILAPHARVVVIGVSGGGRIELDLLRMMQGRWEVTGSTLRSRSRSEKADIATLMTKHVVPLWSEEKLSVVVSQTFPLDEVNAAYDAFAAPSKFGKFILEMDSLSDVASASPN